MEIQNIQTIKVMFRMWRVDGDTQLIALFPDLAMEEDPAYINSYQTIGQHSIAHYSHIMYHSHPAKQKEYADLLKELTEIYQPAILQIAFRRSY